MEIEHGTIRITFESGNEILLEEGDFNELRDFFYGDDEVDEQDGVVEDSLAKALAGSMSDEDVQEFRKFVKKVIRNR